MNTHLEKNPFSCTISIVREFSSSDALKRHMKMKHREFKGDIPNEAYVLSNT